MLLLMKTGKHTVVKYSPTPHGLPLVVQSDEGRYMHACMIDQSPPIATDSSPSALGASIVSRQRWRSGRVND